MRLSLLDLARNYSDFNRRAVPRQIPGGNGSLIP
jgi:hypothetical protein